MKVFERPTNNAITEPTPGGGTMIHAERFPSAKWTLTTQQLLSGSVVLLTVVGTWWHQQQRLDAIEHTQHIMLHDQHRMMNRLGIPVSEDVSSTDDGFPRTSDEVQTVGATSITPTLAPR